jgi:hypothetical protein
MGGKCRVLANNLREKYKAYASNMLRYYVQSISKQSKREVQSVREQHVEILCVSITSVMI